MEGLKTVDDRIAFYERQIEHLKQEVAKAKHDLQTLIHTQSEVERKLFNAQFEKRNPGK